MAGKKRPNFDAELFQILQPTELKITEPRTRFGGIKGLVKKDLSRGQREVFDDDSDVRPKGRDR